MNEITVMSVTVLVAIAAVGTLVAQLVHDWIRPKSSPDEEGVESASERIFPRAVEKREVSSSEHVRSCGTRQSAANSSLHEIMKTARKKLVISGHTLYKFSWRESHAVHEALLGLFGKGVEVTLILLHPDCPYQQAHEQFHRRETTGPTLSSKEQIETTIRFFRDMEQRFPENFSVYLSNYMPRFRTILTDEEYCYVNLYMFGTDVDNTPAHVYHKGTPRFAAVAGSLTQLLESEHVVPLVNKGKFNDDWRRSNIGNQLDVCVNRIKCPTRCGIWQDVRSALLGNQRSGHELVPEPDICDPGYRAGTFTLADIDESEKYLNNALTYDQWLRDAFADIWGVLEGSTECKKILGEHDRNRIFDLLRRTLEFKPAGFEPLISDIWFQEYSDIVRRIILTLVMGGPDVDVAQQTDLTSDAQALAIETINTLGNNGTDVSDWLGLSVITGAVGIATKPNHAAASEIIHEAAIPLGDANVSLYERGQRLATKLREELKRPRGVDHTEAFFEQLETRRRTHNSVRLVSFPDDYVETLFLLKFYERLLNEHQYLSIWMIPRSLRCGNDATFADVKDALALGSFELLRRFSEEEPEPRFNLLACGPKIGGVHLGKIHSEVANEIRRAHILDVRGARNFEMMQGIQKDTFFGFMVARSTSEIVTGLKAEDRPFFYKYQIAGSRTLETRAR